MSPRAGLELSGETTMIDTHKGIQAKAGNATLIHEFQPTKWPKRLFVESLPWLFHYFGMCCAVVGDFVTYMAGSQDVRLLTHWCHSAKTEVRVGTCVLYRIIWFHLEPTYYTAWISGLNDMTQWWNYWIENCVSIVIDLMTSVPTLILYTLCGQRLLCFRNYAMAVLPSSTCGSRVKFL